MAVPIPDRFNDLLIQKPIHAHLATVMADGSPQVTPVWFDYKDGIIRVNSEKTRVKTRNMRERPRVALSLIDPDNPFRSLQIRGRVRHITEDGAKDHVDLLAKKYLGPAATYTFGKPGDVRVIFEIEPTSVQTPA